MKKKEIEERICGIEESVNDLKKCIHILSDRLSSAEEEEECYVLSEAMIMSNAVNNVIKDIPLLLGISPFDMEVYGKIVENFMDGMVKAGYIGKKGAA